MSFFLSKNDHLDCYVTRSNFWFIWLKKLQQTCSFKVTTISLSLNLADTIDALIRILLCLICFPFDLVCVWFFFFPLWSSSRFNICVSLILLKKLGTVDAIVKMIRYEGFAGFYKGMSTKIVQSVLAAAVLFMVKEELVRGVRLLVSKKDTNMVRSKPPWVWQKNVLSYKQPEYNIACKFRQYKDHMLLCWKALHPKIIRYS